MQYNIFIIQIRQCPDQYGKTHILKDKRLQVFHPGTVTGKPMRLPDFSGTCISGYEKYEREKKSHKKYSVLHFRP